MSRRFLLVLTASVAIGVVPMSGVSAQARLSKTDSVPAAYKPPAGMCRVWVDGVPASSQPASTDCASAVRNKPANARVIYGEEANKHGKTAPEPVIKGFAAPPSQRKLPPLVPPEVSQVDPRLQRDNWESKKVSDEQLFGDRPANTPALSYPGAPLSQVGAMGSYSGYVGPNGTSVGTGAINDPRYFNNNPNVRPPGTGSSVCLDRDGDGWCDDLRFGLPTCQDKDKEDEEASHGWRKSGLRDADAEEAAARHFRHDSESHLSIRQELRRGGAQHPLALKMRIAFQ